MKQNMKVAVASLIGGLLVHTALTACGNGKPASAQTASCTQWQVAWVNGVQGTLAADGTGTPGTLPTGWEPISWIGSGTFVRRCAP